MGALQLALIFLWPSRCVYVRACTHVCACMHVCVCLERWQKSQFPGACANKLVTPLGVWLAIVTQGSSSKFVHLLDVLGKGLLCLSSFGISVLLREISKPSLIPLGEHGMNLKMEKQEEGFQVLHAISNQRPWVMAPPVSPRKRRVGRAKAASLQI